MEENTNKQGQTNEPPEEQVSQELSQEPQEKNPFAGQLEIKVDYQLSYKALFEGFSQMNLKNSKADTMKKLMFVAAAVIGMVLMYTGTRIPGMIIFTLGLYFVLRDIIGPVVYRHRISKIISSRRDHYEARFYPTGIRISEKDKHTNILYSDIVWKELKNVYVLENKGKIIVLPKQYLEAEIDNILALAKRNLIAYIKVS